jgi:hypothetical protein
VTASNGCAATAGLSWTGAAAVSVTAGGDVSEPARLLNVAGSINKKE